MYSLPMPIRHRPKFKPLHEIASLKVNNNFIILAKASTVFLFIYSFDVMGKKSEEDKKTNRPILYELRDALIDKWWITGGSWVSQTHE